MIEFDINPRSINEVWKIFATTGMKEIHLPAFKRLKALSRNLDNGASDSCDFESYHLLIIPHQVKGFQLVSESPAVQRQLDKFDIECFRTWADIEWLRSPEFQHCVNALENENRNLRKGLKDAIEQIEKMHRDMNIYIEGNTERLDREINESLRQYYSQIGPPGPGMDTGGMPPNWKPS